MAKERMWDFNPKRHYNNDEYWRYLAILNDHLYRHDLLLQHANDINVLIRRTLPKPPLYHYTVSTLINIISVMFTHLSFKQWWDRLMDSLVYAQELGDKDLIARLTIAITRYYCFDSAPAEAETAAWRAREITRDRDEEMQLQAFAALIESYIIRPNPKFQPEMFDEALSLSARTDNLELKAVLHQMVAVAHLHRYELETAEFHARRSAELVAKLHDPASQFRTLLITACVLRIKQAWDDVPNYLEQARQMLYSIPNPTARNIVLLHYEEAAFHAHHKRYEQAREMNLLALKKSNGRQMAYERALCNTTLSLTDTYLARFDEARQAILKAEAFWTQIDNKYMIAHAMYTRGFIEFKRGSNDSMALEELNEALRLARHIIQGKARESLENLIEETKSQLMVRASHT